MCISAFVHLCVCIFVHLCMLDKLFLFTLDMHNSCRLYIVCIVETLLLLSRGCRGRRRGWCCCRWERGCGRGRWPDGLFMHHPEIISNAMVSYRKELHFWGIAPETPKHLWVKTRTISKPFSLIFPQDKIERKHYKTQVLFSLWLIHLGRVKTGPRVLKWKKA